MKNKNDKILVYVAGVTYGVRQKALKKYYLRFIRGKKVKVTIEREPTNEYDKYAVKIIFGKKEVGYIPKKISKLISKAIKEKMINKVRLNDIYMNDVGIYTTSVMLIF